MQIINLVYSTVITSFAHLSQFPSLFIMASVVVLLFTGIALLATQKKQSHLFFSYYYVVIAVFVILVDILARLNIAYVRAVFSVAFVFLLGSAFGFWNKREMLQQWAKNVLKNKMRYGTLALVVLLSTFFFSKFIYDNGLHDEYLHHAVVEDMLLMEYWPIRDELRYDIYLHDYYHYGWYYVVLLVKVAFSVSVESALDIVKLVLFIPLIPLFYQFSVTFLKTNWLQSIAVALLLLVQGPALFFFDAYAGNVFFSQGNEVIYEPLFFQLAGITWFGIVCMVAFLIIVYELLRQPKTWQGILFILFSLWSLFLLNKAYFLIFVPTVILLGIYVYRKTLYTVFTKRKKLVLLLTILSAVGLIGFALCIQYVSPYIFVLLKGESGIPFVRGIEKWGFPYSSQTGLAFQSVVSWGSLTAFGVLPLLSAGVLLVKMIKEKNKISTGLLGMLWLFLWLAPITLNFSGSELALNKFYIPALWLSLLVLIKFSLQHSQKVQMFVFGLLFSSLVAPLAYFSSISLPGSHHYWRYTDEIIEYLSVEEGIVHVAIDDFEYGKYLTNTLDVQLVSIRTPNIDIAAVAEYEVTTQRKETDVPLAHTDTHYLYEK